MRTCTQKYGYPLSLCMPAGRTRQGLIGSRGCGRHTGTGQQRRGGVGTLGKFRCGERGPDTATEEGRGETGRVREEPLGSAHDDGGATVAPAVALGHAAPTPPTDGQLMAAAVQHWEAGLAPAPPPDWRWLLVACRPRTAS